MKNEINLLMCPFCGGKAGILTWSDNFQAVCKSCGATSGHQKKNSKDAEKAWNTRASKPIDE